MFLIAIMSSDSDEKPISLIALEEAVGAAGGQSALARAIGKQQGHVQVWLRRGKCAPDSVLPIETATGVSRHRLRPDIFGQEPERAASQASGAAA